MKLLQIILFCLFSTYAVGQVNVVGNCHVAGDPNLISALDVMDSFSECAIVYDTVNHIVYKYVQGGTPIWQEIKADGAAIETNTTPSGGVNGDFAIHTNLGQFYIHDGTTYNTQGFPDGDFAKTASLTTNADLTPNLSTGLRYTWSINGNYNLQNPTFGSIGRKGVIAVTNTAGTASTITTVGGNYVDENYATVSTIVIPASATKYLTFRQTTDSGGPVVMLENVTIINPTMGGDLSGTASNAQIVANAVGPNEIATGGVELNTGDVTGTLPVAKGGTGLTSLGSALQVLRVNAGGTALEYAAPSGLISGLTTNYIPKATSGTTIGNSQIFDNGTNVGIGTASPASKLTINGSALLTLSGATTGGLTMNINAATGNNGLFNIFSEDSVNKFQFGYNSSTFSATVSQFGPPGAFRIFNYLANSVSLVVHPNNSIGIGTGDVGTAGLAIMSSTVGIGNNTPSEKLDVTGNIKYSGVLKTAAGSASSPSIQGSADSSTGLDLPGSDIAAISTGGTYRIHANASGNVGIGTTTQANRLAVSGAATVGSGYVATVAPTNGFLVEGSVGIGVNSVVASSILDIGGTTKGSRPFPSLTTTQRDAIATPATGLFAYNTTTNRLEFYNGSAWGAVNTNLFSGALTNTAFVSHTDNFGFEMTGTGAKRLYTTNGTYNNSLIVNSTGSFLSSTDGTNTSNINILANGNAVINSSTGNYLMSTAPQKDSDVAGDLQVRDASGFLKAVDREAFEILTGSGAPVNGTTTAYEVGQIYIDVTNAANPISYYASVKSTDPDAAATGSVWNRLTNSTTLSDADGDTKVQVEESTDEDIIRFDAGGNEVALFYDNRIDFLRRPLITGAGAINNKSAAQLTITNSSNTQYATFFVDDANGDLSIYTNGTTTPQLLIESAGTGIGINTTNADASAALDITSTTQGVLFPRMTTTQRDAITTPAAGLVIFNTTTDKLQVRTSSAWVDLH